MPCRAAGPTLGAHNARLDAARVLPMQLGWLIGLEPVAGRERPTYRSQMGGRRDGAQPAVALALFQSGVSRRSGRRPAGYTPAV